MWALLVYYNKKSLEKIGDKIQPIFYETFFGQVVSKSQLNEIVEIVHTFPKRIRSELTNTICELFPRKRPTGKLRSVECWQFLERLDPKAII